MQDKAEIREGRSRETAELSRLGGENASLAQASMFQKREIGARRQNLTMKSVKSALVGTRIDEPREGTGSDETGDGGIARGAEARKQLVILKETQEALSQQLAEANGAQQR
jgi:hypothetical protein